MNTMSKIPADVKDQMNRWLDVSEALAAESEDCGSAESWPATDEVDGWFWNPTDPAPVPSPADAAFAALSFGTDFDDDDDDDGPIADADHTLDESRAIEAYAQSALERGYLIDRDLARSIARTGLVGHDA